VIVDCFSVGQSQVTGGVTVALVDYLKISLFTRFTRPRKADYFPEDWSPYDSFLLHLSE
jgi:hypothetical protein